MDINAANCIREPDQDTGTRVENLDRYDGNQENFNHYREI